VPGWLVSYLSVGRLSKGDEHSVSAPDCAGCRPGMRSAAEDPERQSLHTVFRSSDGPLSPASSLVTTCPQETL
jgi:hypothetical protein